MQKDQAIASAQAEKIDIALLTDYLKSHEVSFPDIEEIKQYPGGFSNITFCLHTKHKDYILRQAPAGAHIKNAHDMQREFLVLQLLQTHFKKSPKPIIYCDDSTITGMPFYVMEKIEGVILRATQAKKINIAPATFRQLSENWVHELAALHQIDIVKTGLIELGKPDGYVQRQVDGWIARYYRAETQAIPEMNEIAAWLPKQIPDSNLASLLHNDFKYDNVVLHPEHITQIIGILDWEMSTVGHPLMDLGAALAYWSEADDDEETKYFNLTWLPGNYTRKEIVAAYAEKTGFDTQNILFYYVFGLFKNAVIAQQIYARWKNGTAPDDRFATLIHVIIGLAKKGVTALAKEKF